MCSVFLLHQPPASRNLQYLRRELQWTACNTAEGTEPVSVAFIAALFIFHLFSVILWFWSWACLTFSSPRVRRILHSMSLYPQPPAGHLNQKQRQPRRQKMGALQKPRIRGNNLRTSTTGFQSEQLSCTVKADVRGIWNCSVTDVGFLTRWCAGITCDRGKLEGNDEKGTLVFTTLEQLPITNPCWDLNDDTQRTHALVEHRCGSAHYVWIGGS